MILWTPKKLQLLHCLASASTNINWCRRRDEKVALINSHLGGISCARRAFSAGISQRRWPHKHAHLAPHQEAMKNTNTFMHFCPFMPREVQGSDDGDLCSRFFKPNCTNGCFHSKLQVSDKVQFSLDFLIFLFNVCYITIWIDVLERKHSLGIVLMFSNRVHLVSLPTPILTWLVLIIIQEPGNLRPIYIPSLWRCQPCTHMPAIQQLRAPLCVWWMELNKTGGLPYNKPYKAPAQRSCFGSQYKHQNILPPICYWQVIEKTTQ